MKMVSRKLALCLGILFLCAAGYSAPGGWDLIEAIKDGEVKRAKEMIARPGGAKVRDGLGNTPLHWAALAGDAELAAGLLKAGADAKATNFAGATPLHYGAGSAAVVKLLLEAGADPLARTRTGSTPLHSAAAHPRSYAQVRLLLEAGARVNEVRGVTNPFEAKETAISLASFAGDERTVKLLLERGAGVNSTNISPLIGATFAGREKIVKMLVKQRANVNCDDNFAGHPVNIAFYAGHHNLIPYLVENGANLHHKSSFGEQVPPLVWSAYDELGSDRLAKLFLGRGVDLGESSSAGNTVLSWALRNGETPLVKYLKAQGAGESESKIKLKTLPANLVPSEPAARKAMIASSVERSIKLLQTSSDAFLRNGFVKQASCVSCHHQTLPAVTYAVARDRGIKVDEDSLIKQVKAQKEGWSKTRDQAYEMHAPQPATAAVLGYGLHGFHALRYKQDELTEAMSWYLASTQMPDGSWPDFDFRPPMEVGAIAGTALALRALQYYPPPASPDFKKSGVQRARKYLQNASTRNLSERVFRYHGLSWAGATPAELDAETRALLALQREDGGWAPLATLESDAWATGHMLVALQEAGGVPVTHPAYQRGVEFLLRTQFSDGSWWVKSRTWPFQPHFDSQFPHGKDQWISAGATAWATMALLLTIEPVYSRSAFPTAQQMLEKSESNKGTKAQLAVDSGKLRESSEKEFQSTILPILKRSCVECHSGDKPKGGLSVETPAALLAGGQSGEPSVMPGQAEMSPLIRYVSGQIEDLEMPPLNKRNKYPALQEHEIEKLKEWISRSTTNN